MTQRQMVYRVATRYLKQANKQLLREVVDLFERELQKVGREVFIRWNGDEVTIWDQKAVPFWEVRVDASASDGFVTVHYKTGTQYHADGARRDTTIKLLQTTFLKWIMDRYREQDEAKAKAAPPPAAAKTRPTFTPEDVAYALRSLGRAVLERDARKGAPRFEWMCDPSHRQRLEMYQDDAGYDDEEDWRYDRAEERWRSEYANPLMEWAKGLLKKTFGPGDLFRMNVGEKGHLIIWTTPAGNQTFLAGQEGGAKAASGMIKASQPANYLEIEEILDHARAAALDLGISSISTRVVPGRANKDYGAGVLTWSDGDLERVLSVDSTPHAYHFTALVRLPFRKKSLGGVSRDKGQEALHRALRAAIEAAALL